MRAIKVASSWSYPCVYVLLYNKLQVMSSFLDNTFLKVAQSCWKTNVQLVTLQLILMKVSKKVEVLNISLLQMPGNLLLRQLGYMNYFPTNSSAVIEHTDRVLYMEDNDVAAVTEKGGTLIDT